MTGISRSNYSYQYAISSKEWQHGLDVSPVPLLRSSSRLSAVIFPSFWQMTVIKLQRSICRLPRTPLSLLRLLPLYLFSCCSCDEGDGRYMTPPVIAEGHDFIVSGTHCVNSIYHLVIHQGTHTSVESLFCTHFKRAVWCHNL